MATTNYKIASQEKLAANAAKIPEEWRLQPKYLRNISPSSNANVLDIPRACGILSSRELDITEYYDATALLDYIAAGRFSSYEFVLAFCKRAAIAHQLVNCLTEIMFEDALLQAKFCDDYLAKHGTVIGPLHGLPISIKDSFNVKGYQTIMGFASFPSPSPATNNSACVEILVKAGAVCHVRTNVPQTLMTANTENNIFGRTLNPNKLSLTAGGSSGGEGALVRLRGSMLGLGTDLAGSVRIPAFCNGVFGFKSSVARIPYGGELWDGRLGTPSQIPSSIGILGHSVRDINLLVKSVIDTEPWEFSEVAIAVPWRRVAPQERKLRLGFILDEVKRALHPPMLRTMETAKEKLTTAGHTVISMSDDVPSIWEIACLSAKYWQLDPRKTGHDLLKGEPLIESVATVSFPENENWQPSLDELWDMNKRRTDVLKIYHDTIVANQLDAFIMPTYQSTAQPHNLYGVPMYTILANFLNYPAATIPFLEANEELDKIFMRADVSYEPAYVAHVIEGAPSGIQAIGKPMKDEELLSIVAVVAQDLDEA